MSDNRDDIPSGPAANGDGTDRAETTPPQAETTPPQAEAPRESAAATPPPPTTPAWEAAQRRPAADSPAAANLTADARTPDPGTQATAPTTPLAGAAFGAHAGSAPASDTHATVPIIDRPARAVERGTKRAGTAGRLTGLFVAAALVGGAAGLGGSYVGAQLFQPAPVAASGSGTVTINNPDTATQTSAIAAKVTPSVVTIAASSDSAGGTGSGVVLSEDGYVVTNTHVVTLDGATADPQLRVTASDGRIYSATVVGLDPIYDLAVIKLEDASGLTPIEFADSAALNVGDETVAVGAPLGLSGTVTEGIVSALNRSIAVASSAAPEGGDSSPGEQGQGQEGPFRFNLPGRETPQAPSESISIAVIQTDAAINPGNSGGALVDSQGRLIGVNVAIASTGSATGDTSGSIGVGFSIPSNIVERVTGEIIADGAATHGLLGATVSSASAQTGATIEGAEIAEVIPGGAAANGGLASGDVVTALAGVPVSSAVDLTAQVRAQAAGSTVDVTYVRGGQERTAEVTLGALSDAG